MSGPFFFCFSLLRFFLLFSCEVMYGDGESRVTYFVSVIFSAVNFSELNLGLW